MESITHHPSKTVLVSQSATQYKFNKRHRTVYTSLYIQNTCRIMFVLSDITTIRPVYEAFLDSDALLHCVNIYDRAISDCSLMRHIPCPETSTCYSHRRQRLSHNRLCMFMTASCNMNYAFTQGLLVVGRRKISNCQALLLRLYTFMYCAYKVFVLRRAVYDTVA